MNTQNSSISHGFSRGKLCPSRRGKNLAQNSDVNNPKKRTLEKDGESRGGIPYQGRGRGKKNIYHCYKCGKLGQNSFECLENEKGG